MNSEITKETVIDHLVNDTYRIVKSEIDFYCDYNHWKEDGWVISFIGSGRLYVQPVEFEISGNKIWLEFLYTTSL